MASTPATFPKLEPANPQTQARVTENWRWTCLLALLTAVLGGLWLRDSGSEIFQRVDWATWTNWLADLLPSPNQESSWQWVLAPAVAMLALSGSLLLLFDSPPNWVRLPVGLVFLTLQAAYLIFRATSTLSLDTLGNAAFSLTFFLSEFFIHLRIAFGNLSLLRLTDRSKQADASARLIRSGCYLPTVDVFVPTYSESVEMLRRTLIGCQAMVYPNKTVYLLDDQRRPAMKQLAAELGCQYLDRPDNRHAKAGNLNHALARSSGEFILCFDADFVPTTDFLERTIGFFTDPQVAMVQTPQNFFNDDAASRNLGLEGVLQDEQRFFFRTLQPGRDASNALVCHGSCFVVRRSALEEIGGIPTETITEDWATSIKLQAAGYKLYYLNEALSAGASADRCGEFLQQRSRWAQGTLQALFSSANPLTAPGLTLKQRLLHFSGILYYLGSLSSMFNLLAPLLYLVLGLRLLEVTLPELLFYRLPFMVGYYMLFSWMTCRNRSAIWTEFFDAFLAPTIAWTALRSLWKPFGKGFRVTDKSMGRQGLSCNGQVAGPFLVLLVLHLAALAVAWALGRPQEDPQLFAIVAWFALGNVLMLWLCLLVSMDVARHHAYPRFQHNLPAILEAGQQRWLGRTVTVSEGEIVFETAEPLVLDKAASSAKAAVTMGISGLERMPVNVQTTGQVGRLTLEFAHLPLAQRRVLIEYLFCQPGQWDRQRKPRNELRCVSEFYRSALRAYPLAESV